MSEANAISSERSERRALIFWLVAQRLDGRGSVA